MSQALIQAARTMREVLLRETAAARQASLAELAALQAEKQDAMAALAEIDGTPGEPGAAARSAVREMLAAAEENALVLGAVAGALEAVQERLRTDLAEAANPGTYSLRHGRPGPRHSLAASINQTA